jgi:hypothetical protein
MTVDEWISRALATIAEDLRPQFDAYERLVARHRRSRRRRVMICAVVCLVLVAAFVGIVI